MILKRSDLPEEALYEMLPQDSPGVARLMEYLDFEIRQALVDNAERYDKLATYRKMIRAEPNTRVKTFPWPGASNFVVPLVATHGEAVKARVVNTLQTPQPFWVCSAPARGSQWADYAKPCQNFMEWAAKSDLNLNEIVDMVSDQVVFLGECPVKIHWVQDIRNVTVYDRRSRKIREEVKVLRDGPAVEPIFLEDWLEPWGTKDFLTKPWLAHRSYYRIGELRQMLGQKRIYDGYDVDGLITAAMPDQNWNQTRQMAWADVQAANLWEVNVDFDINEDNFLENLIVLFSPESPTKPLSVRYNFFWHQKKPYRKLYYMKSGENRSEGYGICQMLGAIQEALSTFVNQRTDNITIANTKFWKGKKGQVKPGTRIFPGMVYPTNDPDKDLIPVDIGQVSPATFQNESIYRDYAERRSGISDPQLGREIDNPRVAATTTLTMIAEGNKRFDMVIRDMRMEFAAIGTMVLQLYQQFEPRLPLGEILSPEDEIYVAEILAASPEMVERGLTVSVNTSSIAQNEESERQAIQTLYASIDGFYKNVFAIAQQVLLPPPPPEMADKVDVLKEMAIGIVQSAYNAMNEMILSYKIADPSTILFNPMPFLEDIASGTSGISGLQTAISGAMAGMAAPAGMAVGGPGNPPANAGGEMVPVAGPVGPESGNGANPSGGAPAPTGV